MAEPGRAAVAPPAQRGVRAERASPPTAVGARLVLALAALASGAAGLGLEVVLIWLGGPVVGQGRAAMAGLALFIAGWALGARWAGRPGRGARALVGAGALVLVASLVAPPLLLAAGAGAAHPLLGWGSLALALLAVAAPQGVLLPLLARAWGAGGRAGIGGLVAANLLGAGVGARALGHELPARLGLVVAAGVAGALSLAAALVAARAVAAASAAGAAADAPDERRDRSPLSPAAAGLALALLTGMAATWELVGLRLGVLWLGGMQAALTALLVGGLLALALGAELVPRLLPRGRRAAVWLLFVCGLGPAWLASGLGARLASAAGDAGGGVLAALALVGPGLAPLGAAVPVLHRELRGEPGARLGRLLAWEALGAVVLLPLSHWLLVPGLGLLGALAPFSLAAGALMLALARPPVRAVFGALLVAAAGAAAWMAPPPALDSPPLAQPALEVLAFDEDEHFAVSVVDDGLLGERTLLTDGFRAAGTGRDYEYMRVLGHLPLLLHPAPARVGVLAFGTGTTAGAVSLHDEVESIELLEISPAVIARAARFREVNRDVLADERARVLFGDGRRRLAERAGAYDVLTMEPLLPDAPFGVRLYTAEFYERARRALAPGGILCQWVPPHALAPGTFAAVLDAFARAQPWSGVFLAGTQVVLVGAEARPALLPGRFAAPPPALARELERLGLDTPGGLAARFVCAGERWPEAPRPLRDADPWVLYRGRRSAAEVLLDLPRNLAALRALEQPLPEEWSAVVGADGRARRRALASLRAAREAAAAEEAALRGADVPPDLARDAEAHLAAARGAWPEEPELAAFAAEREFLDALRVGVRLLAAGGDADTTRLALDRLVRAAELRPERADVHVYNAVALQRLGSRAAPKALEAAFERCPRILETPAGERALALGLEANE